MRVPILLLTVLAVARSVADDHGSGIADHYRRLAGLEPEAAGSPDSLQALHTAGTLQALDNDPARGLAAAELHLLGSDEDRAFKAARAAWQFLARPPGESPGDQAGRKQAVLLYNLACSLAATEANWDLNEWDVAGTKVRLRRSGFLAEPSAKLVPACLQMAEGPGFRKRVETGILGGTMVLTLPRNQRRDASWPYLPHIDFPYPATVVLSFEGGQPLMELHDPLVVETIKLFGRDIALRADFTAPFAAMADQVDYQALGETGARRAALDLEALYVLEPPRNDKIPVLFVHGLNSSPAAFREMALALRADPGIRRQFQFVVYQYPTGYPLSLLNTRLRKVMPEFWQWFDGRSPMARRHGYVAVGHSMGGLQIKALATSSGDRLWNLCFDKAPSKIDLAGKEGDWLRRMTLFDSDPKLARVIFLAVPHRGSPMAGGLIGGFAQRRMREDAIVREMREGILEKYGDDLREGFRERLRDTRRTSIDNLDPDAPYLRTFSELPIRDGLPYHSIIGDLQGRLEEPVSDGVVPYASSHLENATSELVVHSDHSVQRHPQAIEEVRRILALHLEEIAGKAERTP